MTLTDTQKTAIPTEGLISLIWRSATIFQCSSLRKNARAMGIEKCGITRRKIGRAYIYFPRLLFELPGLWTPSYFQKYYLNPTLFWVNVRRKYNDDKTLRIFYYHNCRKIITPVKLSRLETEIPETIKLLFTAIIVRSQPNYAYCTAGACTSTELIFLLRCLFLANIRSPWCTLQWVQVFGFFTCTFIISHFCAAFT